MLPTPEPLRNTGGHNKKGRPPMTNTKQCTKCGQAKPPDQFGWKYKAKGTKQSQCKPCRNAASAEYRADNPEKVKASNATYYADHREEIKAWSAAHRAANREKLKAYDAAYHADHREERKASAAAYNAEPENKIRAMRRHRNGPAATKIAILDCLECETTFVTRRNKNGPVTLYCGRADCPGRRVQISESVRRYILERDNFTCHICGDKIPDRPHNRRPKDYEVDHLIPRSHGGTNDPSNLAASHKECNSKRSNKGPAQLQLIG